MCLSAIPSFIQLLGIALEQYRAIQTIIVTLLQTLCLKAVSLLPYMGPLKASQSSFKTLYKDG